MQIDSKSLLAKLLATENITVEHRNTSTAYFMPKERIMVLPIWRNMTSELHDLLIGHEVGHALFTPPLGWHNALVDKDGKQIKKGFRSYLNVVEDARIEKLVQNKFPGIKPSFRKGYSELMEKDFFGTSKYSISTLSLIDRINLYFKVGSYLNIIFSYEEQYFVDKIHNIKDWEDVLQIATELYEFGKEEAKLKFDDMEYVEDEYGISDDDFQEDEGEEDDDADVSKSFATGAGEYEYDPESITDRNFREHEHSLLDPNSLPFIYVNVPSVDLKQVIVPYKRIKQHWNNFSNKYYSEEQSVEDFNALITKSKEGVFKIFNTTNSKYIAYLVKDFELKRNAKQYARAAVSKTGELDVKKVHAYRYNDDLFKRVTTVPKGKSHGLVMFVDYSGSMTDNMCATIEQTIVLATFCRKVNIPFRVYAFVDSVPDSTELEDTDYPQDSKFSKEDHEYVLDGSNFRLREYLSSEMSSKDFKDAVKYWLVVGALWSGRYWSHKNNKYTPAIDNTILLSGYEDLHGTPLNEAIVSSIPLVKLFREKYKLDIVNTVFLTDGESNDTSARYSESSSTGKESFHGYTWRSRPYNLIMRDKNTMAEGHCGPGSLPTVALLDLLKNVTGVNVIGFHLVNRIGSGQIQHILERYGMDNIGKIKEEKMKEAKKNKFFMINDIGYDDYYIIPGGNDLSIEEDSLVVKDDNPTKNDFKKAFLKMQKNKSVNRVLLNRFIEKIA